MNTSAAGTPRRSRPTSPPSGCLAAIFRIFAGPGSKQAVVHLPYKRKDYLPTRAERAFFGVLMQVAGERYLVFAKIRIGDLLYLPKGTQDWQSHFNRIKAKHIDFVLCDRAEVRPMLCIELDDSSHARKDRVDRDDFVNRACAAAGLPLLRVPAKRAYAPAELGASIGALLR